MAAGGAGAAGARLKHGAFLRAHRPRGVQHPPVRSGRSLPTEPVPVCQTVGSAVLRRLLCVEGSPTGGAWNTHPSTTSGTHWTAPRGGSRSVARVAAAASGFCWQQQPWSFPRAARSSCRPEGLWCWDRRAGLWLLGPAGSGFPPGPLCVWPWAQFLALTLGVSLALPTREPPDIRH